MKPPVALRALSQRLAIGWCVLLLSGCLGMPAEVTPVRDLDLQRYLGTWYELARLAHRFERGLVEVTAT